MKHILSTLLLSLVALSASAKFSFTEKNFADTISITYTREYEIMVPITIGGETYQFLFDTGASTCTMPTKLADKLFVQQTSDMKVGDPLYDHKSDKVKHGILPEMTIGNLHINGADCTASDKGKYIFGAYLLYHYGYRYKIDLRQHQLIITDRKDLFKQEKKTAYNLPIKPALIGTYLRGDISHGGKVAALFDTGLNSFFTISQKYYDQFCHGSDSVRFRQQIAYTDISEITDYQNRVHKVEDTQLKIDSLQFEHLIFTGVPVHAAADYTGFGCRILEYGSVIVEGKLSYSVYFEPYSHESGVVTIHESVTPVVLNYNTFPYTVKCIDHKSSEYANGIRVGDQLVEINGKPCITADQINAIFKDLKSGTTATLTIRTSSGTNAKTNMTVR